MKNRIERERHTVELMIRLFCKLKHGRGKVCDNCAYLINYSSNKLTKCPFGTGKPACNECLVHCYQSKEREEVRKIMRFSGPKMLFHHPYLAIMHMIDKRRKPVSLMSAKHH